MKLVILGAIVICLGICLVFLGINDRPTPERAARISESKVMTSEIGLAVLHALPFKTWNENDAIWSRITQSEIDRERKQIETTKEWATHLPDGDIKTSYLGWLQFHMNKLSEAEAELQTHAKRKIFDDDRTKIHNLTATLPKPPTPK